VASWWYSPAATELRTAWHDTRRAPGWILFGCCVVFWPLTGFSPWPAILGGGLWLIGMLVLSLRVLQRLLRWRIRRRLRHWLTRSAGVVAFVWLAWEAGPLAWGLAAGLWLIAASLTDTLRARRRILAWLLTGVASTARIDPGELSVTGTTWRGRHLQGAEVAHTSALRTEEQATRDRVATAVSWRMRHAGGYQVAWPPGAMAFQVTALPTLPTSVYDQLWPDTLPGIPVAVTDLESADVVYEERDPDTRQTLVSLPLILVNPDTSEKHWLVIGGTGAGKTVYTRGFIARALRLGWFPGGAWILDGKSSADYIVFEGRQGVHAVAREPEEWARSLAAVSRMMQVRYEEDAEYERGHRPKPHHPRYLLVLEEIQEIRSVLGEKNMDPFLQQLARQMRGSNGRLMAITQRPDTADAMPGSVRDMLEDRFVWGFVSKQGAQMALDSDWRMVVDEYGADTTPGRGVVRIGGRIRRAQSFMLDTPRKVPAVEILYPAKATQDAPQSPQQRALAAPPGVWAPAPPATPAAAAAPGQPAGEPVSDVDEGIDGHADVDEDAAAQGAPAADPDAGGGQPSAGAVPPERSTPQSPRRSRRRTV
jgi:hypothetical protein